MYVLQTFGSTATLADPNPNPFVVITVW